MNTTSPPLTVSQAFYHGAHLVFLDSIGCSKPTTAEQRHGLWEASEAYLKEILQSQDFCPVEQLSIPQHAETGKEVFGIHPFFIRTGW